jgi:CheY-like chemotaxis protein
VVNHRQFVCIVEDDPDIRNTLQALLEIEGFLVRTASNGKEALAHLREAASRTALILLDLMMPVMNGWEFIEVATGEPELASIPIVVVSAIASASELPSGASSQIVRVIKKPVNVDELLDVVGRYCERTEASQDARAL